ncbi:hypothetical protein [Lactobacillus taiwanensis]|nr:hypothetical protein [Lactobacillus taiwanensis]MCR1916350.1 hypothetical protein [Lactobacillus taiwanensis]
MDLFNYQQTRDAAIKARYDYHLAYKPGQVNSTKQVEEAIKKLS